MMPILNQHKRWNRGGRLITSMGGVLLVLTVQVASFAGARTWVAHAGEIAAAVATCARHNGFLPTSCPAGQPPKAISPSFGPAVGTAPAWAVGFTAGLTLHFGNAAYAQHGRPRKILWVVQPRYTGLVRLRGWDTQHGTPLWFQIGEHAPTPSPVLDPRHPAIPFQHFQPGKGYWSEFPSYLFIPKSGCYELSAQWPGGRWQLAFAAMP